MSTEEKLNQMADDLKEIKHAVIGNPDVGLTGLVKRMESVEGKQRALDLRIAAVSGGIVVAWFVVQKVFNL